MSVALSGSAAPKLKFPLSPLEAKPGDLHAFYGQVKAVNRAGRTFTIGLPMRFTFKVPADAQ
ncbi:MAG TPA: hypothetical protein VK993_00385, partial [Chthoniobacterales bacterium]|nr:hypothetical protein [Chthoniobacterales bacterium]